MTRTAPDGGSAVGIFGKVFDDGDEGGVCHRCGEHVEAEDLSVEAFEEFGDLTCGCCADALEEAADEDDGQPDEAQEWADFDPEC